MKTQARRLLNDMKHRAYIQIRHALQRMADKGVNGLPFSWWDAEHQQHDTLAHYCNSYHFQIGDRQGEVGVPLYYNRDLRQWDSVLNMPVEDLADCADYLLSESIYHQLKSKKS